MRKLLAGLILLWAGLANAADNAVTLTTGSGVTMRTVDIGGGVQSSVVILGSSAGAAIYGTAGTANANVLTIQGIASGTVVPVSLTSTTITGTVAATQSGTWNIGTVTTVTGVTTVSTVTSITNSVAVTHASGSVSSGAYASGSIASGAYSSGSIASGALASGSIAAGAMVDLLTMRQTVAAGTVASNSLLTGGQYNSTPITLTNTQGSALQLDANGYLKVNTAAGAAAGGTSSNFGSAFPTPGTAAGFSDGTNMVAAKVGAVANVAAATNMLNTLPSCNYNATILALTDTRYQSLQCDSGGNAKLSLGLASTTLSGWTSATGLNTTQILMVNHGAPAILLQLNQTSTLTVGATTIEGTYDGTNWVTVPVAQILNPNTFANLTNPYTLVASTNQPFLILTQGYQSVRLKLSTAITGSATVTPFVTLLNYNPAIGALLNPLAAGTAIIGKVGVDQTTPGTTNGVAIVGVNAATALAGNGVTGTGSQRVTIASDNTPYPIKIDQTTVGSTNAVSTFNSKGQYETVAASQTGQTLGPTGGTGDYLSHCTVYPTSTSPGVVTVFDNTSTAGNNVISFAGGSSSITNLVPFSFPVGAYSVNGPWKATTGANLVITCYGKFA